MHNELWRDRLTEDRRPWRSRISGASLRLALRRTASETRGPI